MVLLGKWQYWSFVEDLIQEIFGANGNRLGFECSLCRLEKDKKTLARTHRYEVRRNGDSRKMRIVVCENHYQALESLESDYTILKRIY